MVWCGKEKMVVRHGGGENCGLNSILKSIRSGSQKSKFYRGAVSRFLYIMYNQCGVFYSLYWYYELKILHVSVKLPYRGIYFTEKHARWRFMRLNSIYYWDCNISVVFPTLGVTVAKIIDYIKKNGEIIFWKFF